MIFNKSTTIYLIIGICAAVTQRSQIEKCKPDVLNYYCPTFESIETLPTDETDLAVTVETEILNRLEKIRGGENIKYLTITNSLESIEPNAFRNLSALRQLTIDRNELYEIGPNAFSNLNLDTLGIMNSHVKRIQGGAFNHSQVRIFSMTGNNLTILEKNIFNRMRIKYLDLGNNQISSIERDALAGMRSLFHLELYRNFLKSFKAADVLEYSYNVESLDLRYNKLTVISSDMLEGLSSLKTLALDFNQITTIQTRSFQRTPGLQSLTIGHNKLKRLNSDAFASNRPPVLNKLYINNNDLTFLDLAFFPNLAHIDFTGNPWQCKCLDSMVKWCADHGLGNFEYSIYGGKKPFCTVGDKGAEKCDNFASPNEENRIVENFRIVNSNGVEVTKKLIW